jgi:hypothetical protein
MQLRQNTRQEILQLLTIESCDYGVEPRPSTFQHLDFVLQSNGQICPIVTLRHRGHEMHIRFTEGFEPALVREGFPTLTAALRTTEVEYLQQDPTFPDAVVVVVCNGTVLEHPLLCEHLLPFMSFPFDQSVGKGFANDHGFIKENDVM